MINDLILIIDSIEKLKNKIDLNLKTESNANGLLRHNKNEYEKHLVIDVDGIRNTLNKDVEIWRNGLEQTQEEANKVADKVVEYLQ